MHDTNQVGIVDGLARPQENRVHTRVTVWPSRPRATSLTVRFAFIAGN
ncbi:MAG: hypothetical protein U1E76_18120 [Planctomycetota bacterium]